MQNEGGMRSVSFEFPSDLCGLLIGRQGRNLTALKEESGTFASVRPHHSDSTLQQVTIKGKAAQVEIALNLLRTKFPVHKYPQVEIPVLGRNDELARYAVPVPDASDDQILPEDKFCKLSLTAGHAVHVRLSAVVDVGHWFLHLPSHTFYLQYKAMQQALQQHYSKPASRCAATDNKVGSLCAVHVRGSWQRALIVSKTRISETLPSDAIQHTPSPISDQADESDVASLTNGITALGQSGGSDEKLFVRLVDTGGYEKLHQNSVMRLRPDFKKFPFAAVECYLAHVEPLETDASADTDAVIRGVVARLTDNNSIPLFAEVLCSEEDNVPYVQLHALTNDKIMVDVNLELVKHGLAQYYDM